MFIVDHKMSQPIYYLYALGENDYEDAYFLGTFTTEELAKNVGLDNEQDQFMIKTGHLNQIEEDLHPTYWRVIK